MLINECKNSKELPNNFRSPLMKTLDRSVETLGPELYITYFKAE